MSSGPTKLIFVVFLILNCLVWSQSRYGYISQYSAQNDGALGRAHRRSIPSLLFSVDQLAVSANECAPLLYPPEQQCSHVRNKCLPSKTFLSIQYLQQYFCAAPSVRPAVFIGLLVWLVFLFSTLGISASDFFCPNLASIAELLGLDENVAGVTFLAFGNGSPDVFSTFSAMKTNSGSLAIGELLGAASFIVSCVVGSMCIIKPFKVYRLPFLRDVSFFAVAVTLLLVVLWDNVIHPWEAATLVALYLAYVAFVVVGSWWEGRQFRLHQAEALVRAEYGDEELPQPSPSLQERYSDTPLSRDTPTLVFPSPQRTRAISQPGPPRLGIDTQLPPRAHSRTPSPSRPEHHSQMPSFSLVGALEFRQVISSLQNQSATSALSMFDSPSAPFPGGHYHRHSSSRISTRNSIYDPDLDPWDVALGVPMNDRSPRSRRDELLTPDISNISGLAEASDDGSRTPIITLSRTPASLASEASLDEESQPYVPPSRRRRIVQAIKLSCHILFPTLHSVGSKNVLGMIASVLAAPAVFALTVTLPVYVTPRDGMASWEKDTTGEGRLIEFEEEDGVERLLTAEEEVEEKMHDMQFNKWLLVAQCALGPLFCATVLFAGAKHEIWLLIATAISGSTAAILVAVFADRGNNPATRTARCFMGFFIAVVWIMAIADEVVNVLKTFGFIFGLSDAIIGLTIFAVGNSLADFVANISVATFAPIMGFSACFGGPMLNILLGVGISGSYIMSGTNEPYELEFSDTLMVSTVGLLALLCATVIYVPWNDYMLTKRWGVFLIVSYMIIMSINIFVEVKR